MSGRCVTLHVLKATRHAKRLGREPVVRRTTKFVERHVVKSSVAAFVPTIVNDTLMHHQAITLDKMIHVATDDVSVSSMMALVVILMRLVP
jgi:hypothetical protein